MESIEQYNHRPEKGWKLLDIPTPREDFDLVKPEDLPPLLPPTYQQEPIPDPTPYKLPEDSPIPLESKLLYAPSPVKSKVDYPDPRIRSEEPAYIPQQFGGLPPPPPIRYAQDYPERGNNISERYDQPNPVKPVDPPPVSEGGALITAGALVGLGIVGAGVAIGAAGLMPGNITYSRDSNGNITGQSSVGNV